MRIALVLLELASKQSGQMGGNEPAQHVRRSEAAAKECGSQFQQNQSNMQTKTKECNYAYSTQHYGNVCLQKLYQ